MNNPIKPTLKSELPSIILIAVTILSAFYFYAHFPDRVPTHWNFRGEVDGWSGRAQGAFIIPAMLIVMYVLFVFLPMLDPKKERYTQFLKTYNVFRNLILLVLILVYFIASFNGLGYNIPVQYTVPVIIGLLFVVLGNYMGKLKRNWFIGIRTPWTMSSEEVWNKTHRVGGYFFIVAGLGIMISPHLSQAWGLAVFIATIALMVFGTFIYSYILYLKEKKNDKNNESTKPQN